MKCEELLAALNQYVDGDVDPAICESFQKHLEGCNPCQIVVDNIRKTITLYKAGEPYELPAEFHAQLCAQLKGRWKEKFSSPNEGGVTNDE
jgi:anti-sigma factor RsiW